MPNGFSMARLRSSGRDSVASASQVMIETAGGSAKYNTIGPDRPSSRARNSPASVQSIRR